MRIRLGLVAAGMLLLATTLAAAPSPAERGIGEQNGSGQIGTITLYPRGHKTLVRVELYGEPTGAVEPAHIHWGECPKINPVPAYPLHSVVGGRSQTLIDVPVSKLLDGHYSVNVHQSAKNLKHYVACGYLARGS